MKIKKRGIITAAFGSPRYVEMSKTLARSLIVSNRNLPRAIVTDSLDSELKYLFDDVIPLNPEFGSNFRQKLYLDQYTPYQETIYIDSDCIVVRQLDELWELFNGKSFSIVAGIVMKRGDEIWHDGLLKLFDHFGLDEIPKFNGGTYYFDQSEKACSIFKTARQWLENYECYGFPTVRNDGPDDQVMIAVSMALHGVTISFDNGRSMRTPLNIVGPFKIHSLKGICSFQRTVEPNLILKPAIVHFAAQWQRSHYYWRESLRLKLYTQAKSKLVSKCAYFVPDILGVIMFVFKKMRFRL